MKDFWLKQEIAGRRPGSHGQGMVDFNDFYPVENLNVKDVPLCIHRMIRRRRKAAPDHGFV